jgi:N-acetylneuraminic acid mutarotase
MPIAKQELAVVAVAGRLFVIGGFDGAGRVLADVSIHDPAAGTWTAGAPLPTPLHHVNAAVVGARIWIVGALERTSFAATGATLVYDPAVDRWEERAPMPPAAARGASMTAAIGTTIYVAGGLRDGGLVGDFSAYDTEQGTWTELPPLPGPRDHGGGAAVNGLFYAVGGRAGTIPAHLARVDAFDPASRTWSPRRPLPTSRAGAAVGVLDGRIVVAGGEGNPAAAGGVFAEVEVYDPASDTWSAAPAMRTPRHGTGAASIGGALLVPGGGYRQGFGATDVVEALALD